MGHSSKRTTDTTEGKLYTLSPSQSQRLERIILNFAAIVGELQSFADSTHREVQSLLQEIREARNRGGQQRSRQHKASGSPR